MRPAPSTRFHTADLMTRLALSKPLTPAQDEREGYYRCFVRPEIPDPLLKRVDGPADRSASWILNPQAHPSMCESWRWGPDTPRPDAARSSSNRPSNELFPTIAALRWMTGMQGRTQFLLVSV